MNKCLAPPGRQDHGAPSQTRRATIWFLCIITVPIAKSYTLAHSDKRIHQGEGGTTHGLDD
jgi:hypothetical protein